LQVNTQDVIAFEAWLDVDVQVWNFLKCCLANRVPETQALIGKSATNRTRDARHHGHQCGARRIIKFAHIMEMLSRKARAAGWLCRNKEALGMLRAGLGNR
jgi:hypothetical protein